MGDGIHAFLEIHESLNQEHLHLSVYVNQKQNSSYCAAEQQSSLPVAAQ